VCNLTEVLCCDKQGQSIDEKGKDENKEKSFYNRRKCSGNGLPDCSECSELCFLFLEVVDRTATESLSSLYVLIVEEGGGHVTMQVGLVTHYGHWERCDVSVLAKMVW
jgi:hypothetical protein